MKYDYTEVLKNLVRIDTTNPPGNEKMALDYIQQILEQEGINSKIYESAPGRGNLLACLPASFHMDEGAGPDRDSAEDEAADRPLILMSHIDVVLAKESQWKHPPFAAVEEDGYIYGRGTVDTKQLTVMELAAFLALAENGEYRKRDVFLLVTCDEESGSACGLSAFLEETIPAGSRPITGRELFENSEVISEGGGFPILVGDTAFYLCESGQKGCGTVEFTVAARLAKGPFFGSGDGMVRAMKLVADIGSMELEQRKLPTVAHFEQRLSQCVDGGSHGEADAGQDAARLGEVLSPVMNNILTAMNRNTMTVTMIQGKNSSEVKVICDVRLLPGYGTEYLKELTDGLAEKWDADCRILSFSEGYESQPEGGLIGCLEEATRMELGEAGKRAELLPFISMGSSDGRFLVPMKAKVYGYSPVLPWDMTFDQAVSMVHGVDEKIHRESVLFGCRVLERAVRQAVCGSHGE